VKYTGNLTAGATVGHGLSSAPELIIGKRLVNSGGNWTVYAEPVGATAALQLNTTIAAATATAYFNDTAPTDSVFTLGSNGNLNNTEATIAYCFHSVSGYSKIGSYTGNGTGQTIYTTDDGTSSGSGGFQPQFILIKATNNTSAWYILDAKRNSFDSYLVPNSNAAEAALDIIDINSNGFTLKGSGLNNSAYVWIYLAIA